MTIHRHCFFALGHQPSKAPQHWARKAEPSASLKAASSAFARVFWSGWLYASFFTAHAVSTPLRSSTSALQKTHQRLSAQVSQELNRQMQMDDG